MKYCRSWDDKFALYLRERERRKRPKKRDIGQMGTIQMGTIKDYTSERCGHKQTHIGI